MFKRRTPEDKAKLQTEREKRKKEKEERKQAKKFAKTPAG